jgi:hypothetical protein
LAADVLHPHPCSILFLIHSGSLERQSTFDSVNMASRQTSPFEKKLLDRLFAGAFSYPGKGEA